MHFAATTVDNTRRPILDSTLVNEATPFDYGAGHIRPNRAADLDLYMTSILLII